MLLNLGCFTETQQMCIAPMGMTPNIFKIMANSPIVLEGYLTFSATLSKGTLSAQDREQIALTVAGFNHCEYCASAHTALATKAGVSSEETKKNLHVCRYCK